MKPTEMTELRDELLAATRGDDMGLYWVVGRVRERIGDGAEWALVRATTLEVLTPLLRSGQILAVDLLPAGEIATWPGTPNEWLGRIDREWRALGRNPTVGEIVWFYGPP